MGSEMCIRDRGLKPEAVGGRQVIDLSNPLAQLGQGLVVTAGLKIPEGFDQRADAEKLNLNRLKFRCRH